MSTSFLPNSEDTQIPRSLEENLSPGVTQRGVEMPIPLIPETPLPIEAIEGHPQKNEHFLEKSEETPSKPAPVKRVQTNTLPPIPSVRDQFIVKIEKIMEEDLGDVYLALTQTQKQQFKIKGEQTAQKIRDILTKSKTNLGKIIQLIFQWLKILPGVNRFFLEQEAKIKAEKIIALSEYQKHHIQ